MLSKKEFLRRSKRSLQSNLLLSSACWGLMRDGGGDSPEEFGAAAAGARSSEVVRFGVSEVIGKLMLLVGGGVGGDNCGSCGDVAGPVVGVLGGVDMIV